VLIIRSSEPLRRVVIPLDGSPFAEQVLAPALEVATDLDLEVVLFRATPRIDRSQVEMLEGMEPGFASRWEEELREQALAYLRDLAVTSYRPGLVINTVVRHEPAAEAILEYAGMRPADLIAIATHGRTGLQRWVYGSVMEKVLRGAHHSMLVVRPAAPSPR
jgi:nucleotide-binding universal stress UspA family protein